METSLEIIFVDDEQRILDGLRRQLHHRRAQWNMRFALSGAEALRMMKENPADIVVSDMRMPGMTGSQLCRQLVASYPETTRIILSGQTDQADLLRDVACIHQYLQKPCDSTQLCAAIERTFKLSRRISQPILRRAVNRITSLPPSLKNYQAVIEELSKDDPSTSKVAELVAADPAMSAKLMQLVNSAFFGMPRRITSVKEAVVLLGIRTLKGIIVAGRMFDLVSEGDAVPNCAADLGGVVDSLWSASFEIGELAGRLAKQNGASEAEQDTARLAGLLSLLGRAALATGMPAEYARVIASARGSGRPISLVESEVFQSTQDELTAYALGLWAFSDDLVAAVACQSRPSAVTPAKRHHAAGYLHLARWFHQDHSSALEGRMELDPAFAARPEIAAVIDEKRKKAA